MKYLQKLDEFALQETYRQVKINWLVILILAGTYVFMIFSYIHQWGNSPIDKAGLIIFTIIWITVWFFGGRFKLIIDDKLIIFRSDIWTPVKIHLKQIKEVSVVKVGLCGKMSAKLERYYFDYVKRAVNIQLINGKTYQIAIKDAEKIKEEIEKRILITK